MSHDMLYDNFYDESHQVNHETDTLKTSLPASVLVFFSSTHVKFFEK